MFIKLEDTEVRVTGTSMHQFEIHGLSGPPKSVERGNLRHSASWPLPWHVSRLGAPSWWSSWISLSPWQTSFCNLSEKSRNYICEWGKLGTGLIYLKNFETISRETPGSPFWTCLEPGSLGPYSSSSLSSLSHSPTLEPHTNLWRNDHRELKLCHASFLPF